MEETLSFAKIEEINLINCPERKCSKMPDRILKLEGYILK